MNVGARDPGAFIDWLASPTQALPAGSAPWLNLLEEFVTAPEQDAEEARALLARAGIAPERAKLRAFEALVRAGRLHPDENLLLRRFSWRREFPAACLGPIAVPQSDAPREEGESYAIDDPETSEIDDAVELLRQGPSGWRIAIHIADPDSAVPQDSPLDQEAQRRGTTLYLPEGPIPLFPSESMLEAMSLREDQARPALTFQLEISRDGDITGYKVLRTLARLGRRLSYTEADEALRQDPATPLRGLLAASAALKQRRLAWGALIFSVPDVAPRVSPRGELVLKRNAASPARELVSELMIAANLAAARLFQRERLPAVYRAQEWSGPPLPPMPESYDPVACFQAASRLAKTELTERPRRHVGLGLPCYTQVTSPIRRYTDLLLHRQLKAHLRGAPPAYDAAQLMALARTTERRVSEARATESWAREYWVLRYLGQHPNHEATAVVLRERAPGSYLVELEEFTPLRAPLRSKRKLSPGERLPVVIKSTEPRAGSLSLALSRGRGQ